jgi:hypothetical protein
VMEAGQRQQVHVETDAAAIPSELLVGRSSQDIRFTS